MSLRVLERRLNFDGTGGLVIYIANSLEQVQSLVEDDPYIINQARGFEIHEWEIVCDAIRTCS